MFPEKFPSRPAWPPTLIFHYMVIRFARGGEKIEAMAVPVCCCDCLLPAACRVLSPLLSGSSAGVLKASATIGPLLSRAFPAAASCMVFGHGESLRPAAARHAFFNHYPHPHHMPLAFEAINAESGEFGYTEEKYGPLLGRFNDILDQHETGELSDTRYLAALQGLLAEAPDFIDAHTQVAFHWHRQGKPKKALDAALAGLAAATRLVPQDFTGRIEWSNIDNRAYLRLMHVAVLAHTRLRRHKEAAALIEQMLLRNPNDNQGVRYLLGSALLRANLLGNHEQVERAIAVLAEQAGTCPPCWYELALANLWLGRWVDAATALRRGFVANPYIAEILGGNRAPAPLVMWHPDDTTLPEAAAEYIASHGALWGERTDSIPFVRWLFNHPEVMMERAPVMACWEALLWENDPDRRAAIFGRIEELTACIDGSLSAAIVVKRATVGRQQVWPWALQLKLMG
jgi:tetratricopeptide (TPR) repeat protein